MVDQGDAGFFERVQPEVGVLLDRVAEALVLTMDWADGVAIALAEAAGGQRIVSARGCLRPHQGRTLRVSTGLAELRKQGGDGGGCGQQEGLLARELQVGATFSVPLAVGGGASPFGMVVFASSAQAAFSLAETCRAQGAVSLAALLVAVLSQEAALGRGPGQLGSSAAHVGESSSMLSGLLDRMLCPGTAQLLDQRRAIEELLGAEALWMVGQPIVHLGTRRVVAVEALARFPQAFSRSPQVWFSQAEEVGLGVDLELLAVRKALGLLEQLPGRVVLAVNVGPATLCDPRLLGALDAVDSSRVVVELTEHREVKDYDALVAPLQLLRARGVRLSVDDAGAGYANFAHIVRLEPEFIKLDRALVSGIGTDRVRQALTEALVGFAHRCGAGVVAEGIETQEELLCCSTLGVDFGQGYYLGRPSPVHHLPVSRGGGRGAHWGGCQPLRGEVSRPHGQHSDRGRRCAANGSGWHLRRLDAGDSCSSRPLVDVPLVVRPGNASCASVGCAAS